MRIAVNGRFLAAVPTGVQRFALGVAREIAAAADTVLLLPRDARVPADLMRVRSERGRLSGHAWEQIELPRMVKRFGCDVTLNLANSLPLQGGSHAVMIHDATVFQNPEWFSPRYRLWHRRVILPAVRRAGAVGTLSRHAAGELSKVLGRAAHEIVVIPQGAAPLDSPATAQAVERARASLGIEGPYLLAVGAGDPRKNVAFLEGVLARWVREREATAPALVVVGAPSDRVFARTNGESRAEAGSAVDGPRARDEQAWVRIARVGRVGDETLRALYTGTAAFCFPSLAEGFGRPPLEALACGAPVVAAPYGPAREVLGQAAQILPLDQGVWLEELERLVRRGPLASTVAARAGVLHAHRWADSASAALELCERARGRRLRPIRAGASRSAATHGSADQHRQDGAPQLALPDRVAIVHDWLTGMRGGEKVLEALLEIFPRAEIYTLLHVPGSVSEAIESRPIHTSFVHRLPGAGRGYRRYLPLFPSAVERFDLRGFDLVVSSSHCVAKGARAQGPHLSYCHTPMRYVWDQFGAYFGPGRASFPTRVAAHAVAPALRRWDRNTATRVQRFVANSEHVRDRIRRCYGRDARVVYPPVDLERFRPAQRREDFYLIVSALAPYKRVDLAIEALRELGRPLVVVGSGPELPRLRGLAGSADVRFTGWVSDDEVALLLGQCRALLLPGVEDFGITPVEAQAAGAPVIAFGEGGALETVKTPDEDGRGGTGVFFHDFTAACLTRAIARFESLRFEPDVLLANARRFSRVRFLEEMRSAVADLMSGQSEEQWPSSVGPASRSRAARPAVPFRPLSR